MGYRSEVRYVIHDASKTGRLKDYISYLILQNDDDIVNVLKELQISKDYNYIFYETNYFKWYQDYDDVKAHTKIMSFDFNYFDNPESKSIFNSIFIRVGEDMDDNEHKSYNSIDRYNNPNAFDKELSDNGEYHLTGILYVSRSIICDFDYKTDFVNFEGIISNEN